MKKIMIGTLLLCILHAIIIVNRNLGINVFLFNFPLVIFILLNLKENKCIKNKKGLVLMIPILILSLTYGIYDNDLKYLNSIAIPTLYLLWYIFTMKKMDGIIDILIEILNIMIKPLNAIGNYAKECKNLIIKDKEIPERTKQIIKSVFIITPIIIIVLLLLSSADSIFNNIFSSFFEKYKNISVENIMIQVISFGLLFFYLGSTILFLSKEYLEDKRVKKQHQKKDPLTISLLITILNVIYMIFDAIQINSLLLHRVAIGFNYAEYARSGFFQLMWISIINLIILLSSKKTEETKWIKVMSLGMVLLTLIIIISSFYRMYLYEQAYGYTFLRLGVYTILATEGILLLPTVFYILNSKVNILKYYASIIIIIYTLINLVSVDTIITTNNINRYKSTGKIDIYYLMNSNYDNINQLRKLEKKLEKKQPYDANQLRIYIEKMDKRNEIDWVEFNLAKWNAQKNSTWKE